MATTASLQPQAASEASTARIHDTHDTIPITVTFLGGLAPLFANGTTHTISLPTTPKYRNDLSQMPTVSDLISHLASTFLSPDLGEPKSKRDMFVAADSDRMVRPGILVLVNEADWELLGEGEAELREGDEVVFVSTLHGG